MRRLSRFLIPTLPLLAAALPAADTAPIPARERGLPMIRNFLPREYQGHEQIWAIAETADGVMLFSNLNHIAEFDGQNWRTIEVPGGSYLRGMATDKDGAIWVAGDNEFGRLVPDATGRLAYQSMRAKAPGDPGNLGPIWKVYARPDGLWLQGNAALLRWDGAKFDVWTIGSKRTALSYEFEDTILVCGDFGWRLARPGGKWEQIGDEKLAPWAPRFILPRPDGRWLAGTGLKGVMDFNRDGTYAPRATAIDEWLAKCRPYAALTLPDGRHVFTSIQAGALISSADLEPEALLDESAGLATQTVISAHLDRRGVLWLGTDRGIARVELGSPVTVFNQHHGFGRGGVENMQRADGRLLIGGTAGVLEWTAPEAKVGHPKFRKLLENSDRVMGLLRLPDGVITGELTGLSWLSQGARAKVDSPPGVREIVQSPTQPGRFIGTHLNGLCSWRREGGKWIFEGDWKDATGELRGLVWDDAGRLWTSTSNAGLLRVTPEPGGPKAARIERFADEQGLPVRRGRVWLHRVGGAPLFTTNEGMFRFDEATGRFRPERGFGARFNDGGTRVRLMSEDDRGGLWLGVESRNNQPRELLHARAGKWERMPLPNFSDIGDYNFVVWERHGANEILWIGGEAELWQVDLHRLRAQPPAPPGRSLIREITAGGHARPATAAQRFPAKENTVRFAFATPGLASDRHVRHETRLAGFPDGEAEVSGANERVFTNLPAGDYVFEARGLSEDGRPSEPARFAFTVLAPWWRTPWAIALWMALGGLTLFSYIRWRIRGLRRERSRLEAVVAERTAELAQKNLELERLHRVDQDEKLSARLAEEKAQLELLRYQLNPHFLYNSLNSIRALVYSNAEAAGEMVTRLSEFCRATLTRRADDVTTVGEEAEMLQAYLDIERTRWQTGLAARIEIDPAARGEPLPQFLLLPLLENAIKYGGKTSPALLEVVVSARLEDDELVCEVANTGEWVELNGETPRESTRIGLENLRRRIARHYGLDREVQVTKGGGWVRVTLRLPRVARGAEAEGAAG